MVEIGAALLGAFIAASASMYTGFSKRQREGSEAIIKLSIGIEHIGHELEALRADMKEDRHEIYSRLNKIENRVTRLET